MTGIAHVLDSQKGLALHGVHLDIICMTGAFGVEESTLALLESVIVCRVDICNYLLFAVTECSCSIHHMNLSIRLWKENFHPSSS